jgi:hypothetical protein
MKERGEGRYHWLIRWYPTSGCYKWRIVCPSVCLSGQRFGSAGMAAHETFVISPIFLFLLFSDGPLGRQERKNSTKNRTRLNTDNTTRTYAKLGWQICFLDFCPNLSHHKNPLNLISIVFRMRHPVSNYST